MKKKVAQKPAKWTEAHRCEAFRGWLRILDFIAADQFNADGRVEIEGRDLASERAFRAYFKRNAAPRYAARIDSEVRRVRGLAEGRIVRSETTGYKVTLPDGGRSNIVTKQQATDGADPMGTGKPRPGWGIVRVRVTRIRMSP